MKEPVVSRLLGALSGRLSVSYCLWRRLAAQCSSQPVNYISVFLSVAQTACWAPQSISLIQSTFLRHLHLPWPRHCLPWFMWGGMFIIGISVAWWSSKYSFDVVVHSHIVYTSFCCIQYCCQWMCTIYCLLYRLIKLDVLLAESFSFFHFPFCLVDC